MSYVNVKSSHACLCRYIMKLSYGNFKSPGIKVKVNEREIKDQETIIVMLNLM